MKNTIRISIALCIGIIIGSASNAFAAIGDVIEAQFSKFVFVVDGQEKTLEADPLVYQDTTYLPVRVVANLLGKDVVYKADSRTIELNTPNSVKKEAVVPVFDFTTQKPELIFGTIQAMEESLKTETNPDAIANFRAYIDGGKAYLEQIGWDDGSKAKIEDQINTINLQIETWLHAKEIEKDNESALSKIQTTLEELQKQKEELEAQLKSLQNK